MTVRQRADLHVHTTASDGTLTPEQVVQEAAEVGLAALGIADHDSVEGLPAGVAAGERAGVMVVPAIEINTDCGPDELHMLGYFIDMDSKALNTHLQRLRAERDDRARRMIERLNQAGVGISLDRVREIADGAPVGRPHIARAIVEIGCAQNMSVAFGRFLVRGTPGFVERYKLTPFEAIDIIRHAGGVAVIAHPGHTRRDELIPQLKDAGMVGIEVYHTDHSSVETKRYEELARQYNLIATGGSDSHGPDNIKTVPVGFVTVDMSVVHGLRSLVEGARVPGG